MKTINKAVQAVRSNGIRRAGSELLNVNGEMFEDAQEKGRQALKNTENWIKRNPGSAIGAAFVSGVVLNALLRRKKE
jgi:ElaB/YqjD/DUF883 family membrane-anchored ribosome-binding protein